MTSRWIVALMSLVSSVAIAGVEANVATRAELESVKGVGTVLAEQIVVERQKRPFKDWADMIDRVKGVGEVSATKFSAAGLTVGGAAFNGGSARSAAADSKVKRAGVASKPRTPDAAASATVK